MKYLSEFCLEREVFYTEVAGKIKTHTLSFMFIVPCIILYSVNNQQMQLYAVNFIPLLGSLQKCERERMLLNTCFASLISLFLPSPPPREFLS
jgi:thiosulfate reductase cytochrome b subunit